MSTSVQHVAPAKAVVVNKTKKTKRKQRTQRQRKLDKDIFRTIDLDTINQDAEVTQTMKVMKFGGTSVGKPQRMHEVARLITKDKEPKIVVLSALSGTTNALVSISESLAARDLAAAQQKIDVLQAHYRSFVLELVQKPRYRKLANDIVTQHFDFLTIVLKVSFNQALYKDILSQGELLSTKLFCVYLQEVKIDHAFLHALDFMCIDANEEPQVPVIRSKIYESLSNHTGVCLFITQGYICRNIKGEVDNLKRGGSDYTASLVAAAINASVCEIWTDIDGMHNNDPRVVKNTKPIATLSFTEAAELAYFGAKILHPACILPAQMEKVPVKLLNTMQPDAEGTTILEPTDDMAIGAKAVAAKDGVVSISVQSSRSLISYRFLPKVFEVFEKHKVTIDLITTTEVSVNVTIEHVADLPLETIISDLAQLGTVEVQQDQTIISVVGNKIAQTPDVLLKVFESVKQIPVKMVSYGGSQHSISFLIAAEHKTETLQKLNAGIFGM